MGDMTHQNAPGQTGLQGGAGPSISTVTTCLHPGSRHTRPDFDLPLGGAGAFSTATDLDASSSAAIDPQPRA
jgi:hypothetical protein